MSYSEALKFAEGAERARDLAWERLCDEEDKAIEEYNDFCNHLENEFKIPSDNIWSGKNINISSKSHHLDDLAHHPTLVGLIASIITQFTEKAYFQNRFGKNFGLEITETGLIGNTVYEKILAGTVNWFYHLVSDMSGSNKTAGVGMGIPGPLLSLAKEFSMLPGINKTNLPKLLDKAFREYKFDLRSELAVFHQLGKHLFYFFKKRLLTLVRLGIEVLIILHFFEKILLFIGKVFRRPYIHVYNQVASSMVLQTRHPFVAQTQYFTRLYSFFQFYTHLASNSFYLFASPQYCIREADV